MYALFKRVIVFTSLLLSTLYLAACASLPDGADSPKLQIHAVSLLNENAQKQPAFLIEYTVEHHSLTALTTTRVMADVALRAQETAALSQEMALVFEPQSQKHYVLEVPVNKLGSASVDSLRHSSLLMLDATCHLQLVFTEDEELAAFNPRESFSGLVKVIP